MYNERRCYINGYAAHIWNTIHFARQERKYNFLAKLSRSLMSNVNQGKRSLARLKPINTHLEMIYK